MRGIGEGGEQLRRVLGSIDELVSAIWLSGLLSEDVGLIPALGFGLLYQVVLRSNLGVSRIYPLP
jgi:hypothetical protein